MIFLLLRWKNINYKKVQVLNWSSWKHEFFLHRKFTPFIYLLFFCFSFYSTDVFAKKQSDPVLDFARQQIDQKFYQPAISTLNTFLETHKNDTSALYWKAYCFYKLKNYQAAFENYTLVLKFNPRCFAAHVDMANMYVLEKKFNEALPFFNAAISMHDSDINLYNSRGMCYYYADKFEMAIKDFKRVLKLDPNNYLAYNNKGSATYNNQNIANASLIDLKTAESDFNKSIELKPDFELALRNRGIVRYYMDKLDESYQDLLRAIQLEPKDENAHYYLGKLLYKQKNYTGALEFFDNAIGMVNYKSEFYIDRGMCKIEMANFKGARSDFYKSMQLTNNNGYAQYQMARCYAAEGSKAETFDALREAKKEGLFVDVKYFTYISKDLYFAGWAKDKDFIALIQELKFGKNK